MKHLRKQFYNNGYPEWFFNKVYSEFGEKRETKSREEECTTEKQDQQERRKNEHHDEEGNRDMKKDQNTIEETSSDKRKEEECASKEQEQHEGTENQQNKKAMNKDEEEEEEKTTKETSSGGNKQESRQKVYTKIPYIGRPSILFGKKIKALLENVIDREIQVVYTTTKVKDHFTIKDKSPKHSLSKVVYLFQCPGDPECKYVGYTNRTLKERVKEHLRTGTAVYDHIYACTSCQNKGVTIADFKVLKQCWNKKDTAIFEALMIRRLNPELNRNLKKPGFTFNLRVFN